MAKQFDVATCQKGFPGLITSESADARGVWHGIHLSKADGKSIGGKWQSREPVILGNIKETISDIIIDAAIASLLTIPLEHLSEEQLAELEAE